MKKWLLILGWLVSFTAQAASPVPAFEAFKMDVKAVDPNTFSLNWQIKPGYFLYKDRIQITEENSGALQLGKPGYPESETKTDKQGQSQNVYRNQLSIPVEILGKKSGETTIQVRYQGCSDKGFCYPPEKKQIKLTINDKLALSAINLAGSKTAVESKLSESDAKIQQLFTHHHWIITLFIFYGIGILLSFTPCILPMVPVLSGIIIGHGQAVTTKKAFFLSLSYVLSMSITYAIVGAIVALLGKNLQVGMQSPWAISILSIIFIILALSMFGFYEFKLPHSWQSKIAGSSSKQRRGHYLGAAIMGCLSTLILSPCVTAPLIGVLTYIAQTGNVLSGSFTLFILSLGMGTPLLLIGTSAGKWLPQSGDWMNSVKAFFGILLIAVAIYLMGRILPDLFTMGLWAILLIFTGIYSGALNYSSTHAEKFFQGIGIIMFGYGLLILIGLSMGGTNPLLPLTNLQANPNPIAEKISSLGSLTKAIAKAYGKPIVLDFYADWCTSCKIMEATTLKDKRVKEAMRHIALIKIDVTANNDRVKEILEHFNIIAPPTFVFFDAQGKQLHSLKMVGENSVDEFLNALDKLGSNSR